VTATSSEEAVDALLSVSGLSPLPEERAAFIAGYADTRAAVDALYAVPEARYADPAIGWTTLG
jgi:hypothetical protein